MKNHSHGIMLSLLFSTAITLTGCANLNSDFECQKQAGLPCKSMEEVNALIDQGKFENHDTSKETPHDFPYFQKTVASNNAVEAQPHVKEKTVSIWIAPTVDGYHHFHRAHVVDTVFLQHDDI